MAHAALLHAIYMQAPPAPTREDRPLWDDLYRLGCIELGRCTPLGAKVAIWLEAMGLFSEQP